MQTDVAKKEKTQEKKYVETPLMKQYYQFKSQHPDAILLFRVGDFYETFGDDAIKASSILGITLTRRANGSASSVELAGFPHHALDTYLPKLVRAGERVAICEQLEDPKLAKTIVKRGIIELVTPGVVLGDNVLSGKENTFLAAVYFGKQQVGVAFLDISTGEFYVAEGDVSYVDKLLSNLAPKEVIYQRGADDRFQSSFGTRYYTYRLDEWVFSEDVNRGKLCEQFGTTSLKGFGIEQMHEGVSAAGAVLHYLEYTEHRDTSHIASISRIDREEFVWIDKFSIRNLELFSSNSGRERSGFVDVIDRTLSPMGSRMLKRWVAMPLLSVERINRRLDVVEHFVKNGAEADDMRDQISSVGDVERIGSRIAARRVLPREIVQLRNALDAITQLREQLQSSGNAQLAQLAESIDTMAEVRERIATQVYPDPQNNNIMKGGVIADGVDMELDDLRRVALHGKDVLASIQRRESEATGIPSLKISYNNVFGYYIEVRNAHKDKVPEGWIRKQTLTAAERYITAELKEYEEKILGAEEKILAIEQRIYAELIEYLDGWLKQLQRNASIVAQIDCLLSFARIAAERGYNRPTLDDSRVIDIKAGRHPVIETLMPVGEEYIPNDTYLDNEKQQIMMITGPNMSGKSALLRQTALIVLMAQMGSFVPARSARIGVVDKIFTRVGASDNISQGESTFMVEMLESASILNNISDRSLVLLDEIGRGTSTYDGISIAWAMVEYLHNNPTAHARTLFATHYHELNEMEQMCQRVKNYHVSVKDIDRTIVFLRKLERGGTEHSFGIHVAKMAGMPRSIVDRAEEILRNLELVYGNNEIVPSSSPTRRKKSAKANAAATVRTAAESAPSVQLSMFQLDDPVLIQIRDQIKGIDINSLTPLEALNKLNEIKKITGI
ncbi:MAG: DNA mismatch repair protein MutS [Rikenellaceae bacterium]|nr:DNA mismatch repair protein MutS [Rikenellaceae bacterium]MBR3801719.1 DNA mismatch repair protein MutS [Rikenellaceae bacterium]